jgi:hypothetical protein
MKRAIIGLDHASDTVRKPALGLLHARGNPLFVAVRVPVGYKKDLLETIQVVLIAQRLETERRILLGGADIVFTVPVTVVGDHAGRERILGQWILGVTGKRLLHHLQLFDRNRRLVSAARLRMGDSRMR